MRRVEQLITQARRATGNSRVGTGTEGISDEEFIQYLNDAQELCESAIRRIPHCKAFVKEKTWSAAGTEAITLPTDIWARQAVVSLEWSSSGLAADYRPLRKRTFKERFSSTGSPSQYVLMNDTVLVNSYPSTGTFRLIYEYKLPRLDKRRAVLSTSSESATKLTALTLSTSSPFAQADFDLFDNMTAVSVLGVVLMSGIQYTAVSAGGVVTLPSGGFTFATGEGLAAGCYFCLGINSTPTSSLADHCEKFLLTYCQRRILDQDSSADRLTMSEDEKAMLEDIVDTYSEVSEDIDEVPVTNYDYFDDGDF